MMHNHVTRLCSECGGSGEWFHRLGERRCTEGGPFEPVETVDVCPECDGMGRMLDLEWVGIGEAIDYLTISCGCGYEGPPEPPYEYWPEMEGFLVQCPCGTSVTISFAEVSHMDWTLDEIDKNDRLRERLEDGHV